MTKNVESTPSHADVEHLAEALASAGINIDLSKLSKDTHHLILRAREEANHLQEQAETKIRDHPFASVGAVFLAGIALGTLLGRR